MQRSAGGAGAGAGAAKVVIGWLQWWLVRNRNAPPECDQSVSTAASVSLIRTGIGSASRPDAGGAKLGACVREGGLRAESAEEATWSPLAAVVQMLPPPELPEAPPRCCPTLPRSLGGEPVVEGGAGRRGDH